MLLPRSSSGGGAGRDGTSQDCLVTASMANQEKTAGISITVASDSDILEARQKSRALAERCGCRGTDLTLISTAVSEMARIVASRVPPGRIDIDLAQEQGKRGIMLVVHLSTSE